jgi:hypothetical protein
VPTLTAYVANCLMAGDQITRRPDGSWIRDLVCFKCDGWELRFRQRPDVAHGKTEPLRGTFCETTTVQVKEVRPNQLESVLEVLDAICWLLSFAGQSRVICYGYEFKRGSTTGHFKSVVGIAIDFRPPINIRDGAAVKTFVEQTYPSFRRLKGKRKLPVVFDYLVQAERPSQPTEIRLLLLFVTMESLKDTYAREVGIPYAKGSYRKPARKPARLGASFTFGELVLQMLRSVGMRRAVKQIVALRNEIIHSGLSRKPHSRQWQMYERVQDLVREYLVRLLGYQGVFYTYASQGMAPKKV